MSTSACGRPFKYLCKTQIKAIRHIYLSKQMHNLIIDNMRTKLFKKQEEPCHKRINWTTMAEVGCGSPLTHTVFLQSKPIERDAQYCTFYLTTVNPIPNKV